MDTGLRGKVALIAGSSQGIGRAAAEAFAAEGVHLGLCARNAGNLQAAAKKIAADHDVRIITGAFDVADDSAVRAFTERTARELGSVDICVPNAGGPPPKPFLATTMEDWESAWRLNLRSIVSFAQAAIPHMQRRRWGRIVTITSVTVKQPVPELVLSNAIRAGVLGLVRSLAGQFGGDGITANNVGPGFTATDRSREVLEVRAKQAGITVQQAEENLCKDIPVGRMATPHEVANAIVWLAAEQSASITGQTILVDGGSYKGL